MDLDSIQDLVVEDELREIETRVGPALLHNKHRFVLPLVDLAQRQGRLPKPVNYVLFDRFHDAFQPHCIDKIRKMRKKGFGSEELIELCRTDLNKLDNDWVNAGMQLGLIGNAVLFGHLPAGNEPSEPLEFPLELTDCMGEAHRMDSLYLPREELKYQGALSDVVKRQEFQPVWETLGWQFEPRDRFRFHNRQKLVLDIDLQCFALSYWEYIFPWPERMFEKEFLAPSEYVTVKGITAQQFVQELAETAGLLTIERSPNFCGGIKDSEWILEKVHQYVFGGEMAPKPTKKFVVN